MWLTYGIAPDHALVSIADVGRGKTALVYPYCAGPLTAEKRQILQRHLALVSAMWRSPDEEQLRLLLSQRFNRQLISAQLQALRTFTEQGPDSINRRELDTLQRLEMIQLKACAWQRASS